MARVEFFNFGELEGIPRYPECPYYKLTECTHSLKSRAYDCCTTHHITNIKGEIMCPFNPKEETLRASI